MRTPEFHLFRAASYLHRPPFPPCTMSWLRKKKKRPPLPTLTPDPRLEPALPLWAHLSPSPSGSLPASGPSVGVG